MTAVPSEITPLGYPPSLPPTPTLVAAVLGFGWPLCGTLSGLYLQCVLSLDASVPWCGGDPQDVGTAGNVPQAGAPHCAGSSWEPGDSLIKRFIIKAAAFLGACFLLLLWGQTGRHPAGAALGDSMQPDTPLRILNLLLTSSSDWCSMSPWGSS